MRIVIASPAVLQQSGGPAVAAVGFARALAARGHEVELIALERGVGDWIVDERQALEMGFGLAKVRGERWIQLLLRSLRLVHRRLKAAVNDEELVVWINGIWGPHTLGAALACRLTGTPYIVRPAGSLGKAALAYSALKKRLYYCAVERRSLLCAAGIHCMTEAEREELPSEVRPLAFVVPTGVDNARELPSLEPSAIPVVGVLARLHPIKRQHLALDIVKELARQGAEVRLELAGASSAEQYREALEARVRGDPDLSERVTFLGHVPSGRIPDVVGRWSVALLVSEQENFGHAVLAAAANGVPSLVTPGVGIGAALSARGAGVVAEPAGLAAALVSLLSVDRSEMRRKCLAFAAGYGWSACAAQLEDAIRARIHKASFASPQRI